MAACQSRSDLYNPEYSDIEYCEIVPLLEKTCLRCHNSLGIAPFSFENTALFQRKKSTILQVLDEGIMPPWKPNPQYSRFKHEYFLNSEEKQKIYTWIHNGANDQGECHSAPRDLHVIGNNGRGEAFYMNHGYTIPENIDHYKCFIVANPYHRDVYLSAIDLIPGNYAAVHHISAFLGTDQSVLKNCQDLINPDCDCDETIDSTTVLLANWSKGSVYRDIDKNYGFLLPKDAYLQVQIHYSGGFEGASDSSRIAFTLADTANVHRVYCDFYNNFKIHIEPNEKKYDTLEVELTSDIRMTSIWPHTHNITTYVKCFAISKKDTIPLIEINEWDYLWQCIYEYKTPVALRKGDKVYMVVLFDNTTGNKRNPHSPPMAIDYGRKASDEMLSLVYYYFIPK